MLSQWDAGGGRGLLLMTQEQHAAQLYREHGFGPVAGEGEGIVQHRGGWGDWFYYRPAQVAAQVGAPPPAGEAPAESAAAVCRVGT